MDISNLSVGDFYKNYPALCSALNISVKTHNTKDSTLKDLARYVKYEHPDHKHWFKIIQIYDTPKPEEEGRNKPSTYAIAAYAILLNELLAQYEKSILVHQNVDEKAKIEKFPKRWYKKSEMLSLLGFVKNIFAYIRTQGLTEKAILDEVRENCKRVFGGEIKRISANLEKTKLLRIRKTCLISCNGEEKVANKKKTRLINSIKRKILDDFNYKSEYAIYIRGLYDDFYEELNSRLRQYGIHYIMSIYEVSLYIDREIKYSVIERINELKEKIKQPLDKYITQQKSFLHEHFCEYVQTANENSISHFLRKIDVPKCLQDEYHTEFSVDFYKQYEQIQQQFTEQLLKI